MTADVRRDAAMQWVATRYPNQPFEFAPASADASFRRYFRATFTDGARRPSNFIAHGPLESLIVMDAPPEQGEDCRPFVEVASLFGQAGANVPNVHAADLERGFLLLDDLGATTFLDALNSTTDETVADGLYRDAISTLIGIQQSSRTGVLRDYDHAILARELQLFPDWFITRQLGRTLKPSEQALMGNTFAAIVANNLAQPRVFVHRDYHSRNLMVSAPNPGVLDFQDALYGPITYDLVSLLRDAYISWPEAQVLDWAIRYWSDARGKGLPVHADFANFYRDFEWMGVQRQLKVVGIFARLAIRDGKRRYLDDQPLVMRYLRAACARYIELKPFSRLLDDLTGTAQNVGYTF